jgi:iron-sulfur cluster repair protein YtfE (RIC family)
MALDNNNFCNDERCEWTKRSKKHIVHDVADYHDRRAESIKNLIELGTDLRKVEK